MKILVDADACPVKDIIIRTAKKYNLDVVLFIDTSHILQDDYAQVVTVEKGRDSVDIALVNRARAGDIVVTQDYGLAALALGRGTLAIHPSGLIYHEDNMDRLLFERHISSVIRKAGGRLKGPSKRKAEDDGAFLKALEKLIRTSLRND
jgi:uncharacterized protein YaiI (UPF0178 family)